MPPDFRLSLGPLAKAADGKHAFVQAVCRRQSGLVLVQGVSSGSGLGPHAGKRPRAHQNLTDFFDAEPLRALAGGALR